MVPAARSSGPTIMRGVASGPNEEFGSLRLTLMGALAQARKSLRIATPYFLPDEVIVSQLCVAALRGVTVDIVLPKVNNQFFAKWAESASFPALLTAGCRIWTRRCRSAHQTGRRRRSMGVVPELGHAEP
jgi:cardiolipin synthase